MEQNVFVHKVRAKYFCSQIVNKIFLFTEMRPRQARRRSVPFSVRAQSAFGLRFDLVSSGTAKSHNRGTEGGERAEKVMLKLSGHGGSLLTRQILLKFGDV